MPSLRIIWRAVAAAVTVALVAVVLLVPAWMPQIAFVALILGAGAYLVKVGP